MDIPVVIVILVLLNIFGATNAAKTVCLDTQADFQPSAWKFNTVNYKYVDSASQLPRSFGNLNFLEGNGIWYVEGVGNGKEIKMTSDPSLYNARSRSVKIYLRYYEKSPRRISLQPIKSPTTAGGTGPVMFLPLSTGNQWTEVSQDINPAQTPIEVSAVLSEGQFILFELVVIAVDTSLPKNATAACMDFTVYANQPTVTPGQANSPTTAKPAARVTGNSVASPSNSCPSNPPPTPVECKCNCNCNCNKPC